MAYPAISMDWPNQTWLGHGQKLRDADIEEATKAEMKRAFKEVYRTWDLEQQAPPVPSKGKTKRSRLVWAVYKIAAIAARQLEEEE